MTIAAATSRRATSAPPKISRPIVDTFRIARDVAGHSKFPLKNTVGDEKQHPMRRGADYVSACQERKAGFFLYVRARRCTVALPCQRRATGQLTVSAASVAPRPVFDKAPLGPSAARGFHYDGVAVSSTPDAPMTPPVRQPVAQSAASGPHPGDIEEHVRLHFFFVEAMFDQVADADDALQLIVVDDRQVTDPRYRHGRQHSIDAV